MFNKFYPQALDDIGYEPVDSPDIDIEDQEIESGKGFTFHVKFLTEPEVHLDRYKGIEIEIPDVEVTERLIKSSEIIGIKLLDHVILGNGIFTSMKSEGYFDNTFKVN